MMKSTLSLVGVAVVVVVVNWMEIKEKIDLSVCERACRVTGLNLAITIMSRLILLAFRDYYLPPSLILS